MIGAMARGDTVISGFLRGEDCLATLVCLRALGVDIEDDGDSITVHGAAAWGLREPPEPLNVGNAGTLLRLLAGVVAAHPITCVLDGDESIRSRPMDRIARPLEMMGCTVTGQGERCVPPITIRGGDLRPITYHSPVASAQVKSCVLLAGCKTDGVTEVIEPAPSRDHTERMLRAFGALVESEGKTVKLTGPAELNGRSVSVPGDISSAAFYLAAGLLVPGSCVTVRGVGVNPTRTGILDIWRSMGAPLDCDSDEEDEPAGDLMAEPSVLTGSEIGGDLVPRAIDELPLAAVCACFADGETTIRDAAELRVKESDRVASTVAMIVALGGRVEPSEDGMTVFASEPRSGTVNSGGDHRIAMAAVVAGLALKGTTRVRDTECVNTSFPGFVDGLRELGADVAEVGG